MKKNIQDIEFLTDHDIYLFKEGNHFNLYEKLGSHLISNGEEHGASFAVWAPNATKVSVIGDFNEWTPGINPLRVKEDSSGIWEGFIPGISQGCLYKYHITSNHNHYSVEKADPLSFYNEMPPKTASMIWDLDYKWDDESWMKNRKKNNSLNSPFSIYEIHFGSWRRVVEEDNRPLTYREMAAQLIPYLKEMGFTHVEFLPLTEHPFYGSWGYQTLGYFAPTSRYGTPQDMMYLIDQLHQAGIGVILDWTPSHFPDDEHGLVFFDGTHLYEHADPQKGFHPEWNSHIFNHGRNEVCAFLISSALFWLKKYHIDGLRVDAVASMLYLDYARKEGEWIPNMFGGNENFEAKDFLCRLNQVVYEEYPDIEIIAEESTAWPMVTRPPYMGGLGFGMKWNMGWMHDTLDYFTKDPIYRKHHQNELTFSLWYAFTENFVLSLSHDEVVHGKGSLINKMPGDDWQKFANLRLLYGYMYMHPGKKLLFMGAEIAQWEEWSHESSLDWHLLQYAPHKSIQKWLKDLNRFYKNEPALYELDFESNGFKWVDCNDWEGSIISFLRTGKTIKDQIFVVCNMTPVPRSNYRIGIPLNGLWKEVLNSDAKEYGGSGFGNFGGLNATPVPFHGFDHSLSLTIPPLGILIFKAEQG